MTELWKMTESEVQSDECETSEMQKKKEKARKNCTMQTKNCEKHQNCKIRSENWWI